MHCMLDLETLDTKPTALILSIGAVMFDKDCRSIEEFYGIIELDEPTMSNFTISASTLGWWFKQEEAIKEFARGGQPLKVVLSNFSYWFKQNKGKELWGNGATFDNVILKNAYDVSKMPTPWSYKDDCCYRTIIGRYPKLHAEFSGVRHNALMDAIFQADYLVELNNSKNLNIL